MKRSGAPTIGASAPGGTKTASSCSRATRLSTYKPVLRHAIRRSRLKTGIKTADQSLRAGSELSYYLKTHAQEMQHEYARTHLSICRSKYTLAQTSCMQCANTYGSNGFGHHITTAEHAWHILACVAYTTCITVSKSHETS